MSYVFSNKITTIIYTARDASENVEHFFVQLCQKRAPESELGSKEPKQIDVTKTEIHLNNDHIYVGMEAHAILEDLKTKAPIEEVNKFYASCRKFYVQIILQIQKRSALSEKLFDLLKLWVVSTLTLFTSVVVFWWYGFFIAFTVFTLGITGILYGAQDLLLYYPNDPPDSRVFVLQPSNYKLPYESIKIKNKDGFRIHMFLIKQTTNSNHIPTMIFFHGNAGNMGQRLSNVSGFYHKLNINILMVEYRGYGLSEGSPSERGLYNDAQTALDYILQRSDIDRSKIVVFGRSLGNISDMS
ncbi:unnamed protein product [Parnassius apollo]|uniref:(apollo) hypothetical protein n=1 Tax=Parnassius apollo TaxID=110799 RepID=A0A8S3WIP0_PARAO|nr:unnamed protein product [Parnassius apollo]